MARYFFAIFKILFHFKIILSWLLVWVMADWIHLCKWVETTIAVRNDKVVFWISLEKEKLREHLQVLWMAVLSEEIIKQPSPLGLGVSSQGRWHLCCQQQQSFNNDSSHIQKKLILATLWIYSEKTVWSSG